MYCDGKSLAGNCRQTTSILFFTVLSLTASVNAGAQAALTPDAASQGFVLSTFVNSVPNNGAVGPIGLVSTPSGNILVSNFVTGEVRSFANVDNTPWSSGVASVSNYGFNNIAGLATVGGNFYLAAQTAGVVAQVNSQGDFIQPIASIPFATGLVGNPATGNLFVSTGAQILSLNPSDHSVSVFADVQADGMSISADNTTLYAASIGTGHVLGFDIATGVQGFDSGFIPGGVDGTALGSGVLDGKIFVNTNGGLLWEVDLTSAAQMLVFSGGSRGDFVIPDANGTLLLTQTDSVLRLAAPGGGGFGTVPLPAAAWLLVSGLGFFAGFVRKLR